MAKYPPPVFDTIEEYEAAAALLGMEYDPYDHTFMPLNDYTDTVFDCLCPDTMTEVYGYIRVMGLDYGERFYQEFKDTHDKRKDAVKARMLGPRSSITPG